MTPYAVKTASGILGFIALLLGIALGVADRSGGAAAAILFGAILITYYLFTGDQMYLFKRRK